VRGTRKNIVWFRGGYVGIELGDDSRKHFRTPAGKTNGLLLRHGKAGEIAELTGDLRGE